VDGKQNSAILDSAFISFGFIFWNSHADQSARYSANRASYARSGERSHDWTGGEKGSDARDSEGANAGQPAQSAPEYRAGPSPGRGAFWSLGAPLMGEIL
jgi:hypothetical protein